MTMQHPDGMHKLARAALIATSALVIIAATVWGIRLFTMSRSQAVTQSTNPASYAIGGFPMTGNLPPDFTLVNQFGQSVTLSSLRAHEGGLAFIDPPFITPSPPPPPLNYHTRLPP